MVGLVQWTAWVLALSIWAPAGALLVTAMLGLDVVDWFRVPQQLFMLCCLYAGAFPVSIGARLLRLREGDWRLAGQLFGLSVVLSPFLVVGVYFLLLLAWWSGVRRYFYMLEDVVGGTDNVFILVAAFCFLLSSLPIWVRLYRKRQV